MATNHQLAQLIDGVKLANNWSDPRLVKNAEERGHVLSKSNISRYRLPLVSIKGEVILALAAGLRVTPSQVAVAAVESMGIHLPFYDSPTPEQAVQLDTNLSSRDKESLLTLLRQLRTSTDASASLPVDEDKKTSRQGAQSEGLRRALDAEQAAAELHVNRRIDEARKARRPR